MTSRCNPAKAWRSRPASFIRPSTAAMPPFASWLPASRQATTIASTTNNQQLSFIDLQVDVEFFARVERGDVLDCALLAIALRPKLIVGVRQQLVEAIGAI